MTRSTRLFVFCCALLALGAVPAAAQVVLVPKIGLYAPASGLGEAVAAGQAVARDRAGSLAIGLGLELGVPVLPFGVRGNLEFATGSTVTAAGTTTQPEAESTLLVVVADAVFRPLPRLVLGHPYLLVGGGLKRHEFQVQDLAPQDRQLFPPDQSNPTFHIGAGLDFALGPLGALIEVSDYISRIESETAGERRLQNDIFVMIGLRVSMF
jgi:hypothetical protein